MYYYIVIVLNHLYESALSPSPTPSITTLVKLRDGLTEELGEDDLRPLAVVALGLNPSDGFPVSTMTKLVNFFGQKYDPNPFSFQIKNFGQRRTKGQN